MSTASDRGRTARRYGVGLAGLAALLLAGCGYLPPVGNLSCAAAPSPALVHDGQGSASLDVLTYNIEGLAWPARSGRAAKLAEIGRILADLQKNGTGPDIVLFQEAFSRSAVRAVTDAGYPALVAGPGRTQRGSMRSDQVLPGKPKPAKGELGLRFLTAGLAIASRYPIVATVSEPYSRASCAGFDCLANKGVLLAEIVIPGVPEPIQLINTHMNAQQASRVAPARHLASHNAQTIELAVFLDAHVDPRRPVILGGDFNMRHAPERFDVFHGAQSLELVHQHCIDAANGCDVRMSWDGDAPWMDTQDLQLFSSGAQVRVAPVRVEAMFDGGAGSPQLSDHDGLRVVYALRWKGGLAAGCR